MDETSAKVGGLRQTENMRMTLKRDYTMNYCGTDITLPKGTRLQLVRDRTGKRTLYAVRYARDLVALTGNTHDPKYRYCFVPEELVDQS